MEGMEFDNGVDCHSVKAGQIEKQRLECGKLLKIMSLEWDSTGP